MAPVFELRGADVERMAADVSQQHVLVADQELASREAHRRAAIATATGLVKHLAADEVAIAGLECNLHTAVRARCDSHNSSRQRVGSYMGAMNGSFALALMGQRDSRSDTQKPRPTRIGVASPAGPTPPGPIDSIIRPCRS